MMKDDYSTGEIIQEGIKYASSSTSFGGVSHVPRERN